MFLISIQKLLKLIKQNEKMKKPLLIIIGLFLLSFLIYKIGIKEITETAKNFNFLFLPLIIVVFLISYILAAINIWVLLRPYKKISIAKLIKYVFFILFYSSFTPGKIADFFLIFYLKKDNININKSTIITIFDKSISVIIKSLFGIIGALFILKELNLLFIGIPIIMIFLMILLFLILLSKRFRDIIKKLILKKYSKIFKGFSKNLKKYIKNYKKELLYNGLITILKTIFEATLLYLLFLSFGENTNFIKILLIFSLLSVVNFIILPIGISGLGLREALGVIMYSAVGVNSAVVFSSYILRLIIVYLTNLITFLSYSKEMNLIKKHKLFDKVKFK